MVKEAYCIIFTELLFIHKTAAIKNGEIYQNYFDLIQIRLKW